MVSRVLDNLISLLMDLPDLFINLFDDNQGVVVVCVVMMLAYWCFLQKN